MTIKKEITLYHYHELSEKAKERARDWWLQCVNSTDYEPVIEDAVRIATCLGITFDERTFKTMGGKTRSEPDIRWSGFSSQGDGASFNGVHQAPEWNMVARIKSEAPQDQNLHATARVLEELQSKYKHKLRAVCKYSNSGLSYAHSGWMGVEIELLDDPELPPEEDTREVAAEDQKLLLATLRGFADWIYEQLEKQWEYLCSEEQIAETMEANQYTFLENGKRFS